MAENQISGHCLCQATGFTSDEKPNWAAHCHCKSCRRATSSPMTTWISVPRDSFRFTRGKPRQFNSSADVVRSFCQNCGSQLTYENSQLPDEIHIYAALLDDPSQVQPERHVFVEEQLPWADTIDNLPRYATTRASGEPPLRYGPKDNQN